MVEDNAEDGETSSVRTMDLSPALKPPSDDAPPVVTKKVDPITALQESIDGLSLAMFEALRGVRDAVAPESGNLGMASQPGQPPPPPQQQPTEAAATESLTADNVDEMWRLYRSGDVTITKMMQRYAAAASNSNSNNNNFAAASITRRDEFVRMYTKMEMERKDSELVGKFAALVLEKFDEIHHRVDNVPGLHRTRTQQLQYIQQLMDENAALQQQLDQAYYQQARPRQAQIHQLVRDYTNRALGMEAMTDERGTTTTPATTTTTTATTSSTPPPPEDEEEEVTEANIEAIVEETAVDSLPQSETNSTNDLEESTTHHAHLEATLANTTAFDSMPPSSTHSMGGEEESNSIDGDLMQMMEDDNFFYSEH